MPHHAPCQSYPEGVQAVDVYGRLALHYAVDKVQPPRIHPQP